MAIAAALVLLAACGGDTRSTGTSADGSSTEADGGQLVSATHGGFRTIIPSGYRNGLTTGAGDAAEDEYLAIGPRTNGFATSLTVLREATSARDLSDLASGAMQHLSQRPAFLPKVRHISSLRPLVINGEPAFAVDYQVMGRKLTYRRDVFVIDGAWAYQISDLTVPAQYAASVRLLNDVIRSWRWSAR